jgi:hypothetical protein
VRVFVLYANESQARAAVDKLHKRYFGGNIVKATYYSVEDFKAAKYDQ